MDIIWNIVKILGALGIIGGIGWLLTVVITHKATEFASKKEIEALEKRVSDLERANVNLEEDNDILRSKIFEYTDKEKLFSKYEFDNHRGIHFHKETKKPFCPHCLTKNNLPSELQTTDSGWLCAVCGKGYHNPDWHPPKQNYDYLGGGYGS